MVFGLLYLVPTWEVLCALLGSSPAPLTLTRSVPDGTSALNCAEEDGNGTAIAKYYFWQTMLYCFNAKYYEAIEMAKKSSDAVPEANLWLKFYEGLSALAIARNVQGRKRWHYMSIGRRAAKYVKACAKTCPSNFPNKQALLEAELAAAEGNAERAIALFNISIKKAC